MEEIAKILDNEEIGQVVVILFTAENKTGGLIELTFRGEEGIHRTDITFEDKQEAITLFNTMNSENVVVGSKSMLVKMATGKTKTIFKDQEEKTLQ